MVELSKLPASGAEPAVSLVVIVDGISAGFAVQEESGLRFRAVHPRFEILDGSRFPRVEQLTSAAKRLAKAAGDRHN
jgi:hypothetical protein